MALTSGEIDGLWQRFMEQGHSPGTVTKADVRAAIVAIDAFLDAQSASINAAFPVAFRSAATAAQKAMVVGFCAFKRAGREVH